MKKKRTLLLLLKTKMLKEKEQKVLLLTKLQIQTFYTDLRGKVLWNNAKFIWSPPHLLRNVFSRCLVSKLHELMFKISLA